MNINTNKIVIDLNNGMNLVAEQNTDPNYDKEIYIYIAESNGCIYQDLAVIRNSYKYDDNYKMEWIDGQFDVLIYGNPDDEDYTDEFKIGLSDYGQY